MEYGCTFCGARIHTITACPLYRNNFAMNSELQELKFNLTRQLFMLRILQRELQEQVQNEVPNEIQNEVRQDLTNERQTNNNQNNSNNSNDSNDNNNNEEISNSESM
tara:strand:+ start:302 stop:622 length:321 start_codon:yes stop_codon:yes gene_type:complete